jgi:hypothetical protein
MNFKFLLPGKIMNIRVVSRTTILEIVRVFSGEIYVIKTVIVENSVI